MGLTICLTDIRRMSCAVRKEKEMLETTEGMAFAMFMTFPASNTNFGQSRDLCKATLMQDKHQ